QPAQRLANRHRADAERLGEAADGHGGAGRDAAGHQRMLQLFIDFLVQRVALKLGHFQFELAGGALGGAWLSSRCLLGGHVSESEGVVSETLGVMRDHNNYNIVPGNFLSGSGMWTLSLQG